MKKPQLCALILACSAIFFLFLLLPLKNAGNLYDSVIRIHVLANSDSEADQTLKLSVRDSILKFAREELDLGANREEAKREVEKNLDAMETLAKSTLRKAGCFHDVSVGITEEYYPTRTYETLSLPAGKYLSLRVQIGKAEGKNWWCVLFPPLCLSSSVETEDALASAGMDEENVSLLMGKEKSYRVRFKLLELIGKTKQSFGELF